jgi:phosphoglycolate phosphatase
VSAVVYDLDGTLVRLDVDWAAVEQELATALRERGVDAAGDAWEMLDTAEAAGCRDAAEAAIAPHERAGADDSALLPLAEELPREGPVAVCSLNCEAAVRDALDRHGLAEHVDAVVGRDSGPQRKPDPEALLAAVDALGVAPADALFVGDSDSDALTAERAGVPFVYASERRA